MFSDFTCYEKYIPPVAPISLADLSTQLRIYQDEAIEVWYSPMGVRVAKPKLWILGITPGWNQVRIAYEEAANAMASGMSPTQAAQMRKPRVAFAGSMRANLITMLDTLGVATIFDVDSCAQLFESEGLRTGSVLKYPVFKQGKNYTGHSPKPISHPVLQTMIDQIFADELQTVGECLILPLGKMVEDVLAYTVD